MVSRIAVTRLGPAKNKENNMFQIYAILHRDNTPIKEGESLASTRKYFLCNDGRMRHAEAFVCFASHDRKIYKSYVAAAKRLFQLQISFAKRTKFYGIETIEPVTM